MHETNTSQPRLSGDKLKQWYAQNDNSPKARERRQRELERTEHLRLVDEDDQTPPAVPGREAPGEREPFDPPAPVGSGWGGREED